MIPRVKTADWPEHLTPFSPQTSLQLKESLKIHEHEKKQRESNKILEAEKWMDNKELKVFWLAELERPKHKPVVEKKGWVKRSPTVYWMGVEVRIRREKWRHFPLLSLLLGLSLTLLSKLENETGCLLEWKITGPDEGLGIYKLTPTSNKGI